MNEMSGQEVKLSDNEFIVSKTDTKGRITYANRVFMNISGYSEGDLLGKPHSLIRHPDMPRGAFYLLWKTLQEGKEFFAFVKNACANGDYYWVFANITPDYDAGGSLQGYYSVRRKPSSLALAAVIPLYQQMRQLEREQSANQAAQYSANWLLQQVKDRQISYEQFVLQLQSCVGQGDGL